jgi:hypothetical protein
VHRRLGLPVPTETNVETRMKGRNFFKRLPPAEFQHGLEYKNMEIPVLRRPTFHLVEEGERAVQAILA